MSIALKDSSYLTVDEVKEWLKVKPANENEALINKLTRLINTACSRVESFIQAPVLTREFTEFCDGSNSNVIVPSMYPVKSITEVNIDFNRAFSDNSVVNPENYVLRGIPAMAAPGETPIIEINGADIVLRDDSNVAILGRIFSGSTVQSIKVTYTAGRGEIGAIPDDLVTATLMLVEYLYMISENRELGVGSKGVMGQSYTKKQLGDSGMPEEIEAMLKDYVDMALPNIPLPQRNTFRI